MVYRRNHKSPRFYAGFSSPAPLPEMYHGVKAVPVSLMKDNFRSRLEARWAFFFSRLDWAYFYEPSRVGGWLPDFMLPGSTDLLIEIKPIQTLHLPTAKQLRHLAEERAVLLLGEKPFVVSAGLTSIGWLGEHVAESPHQSGCTYSIEPYSERFDFPGREEHRGKTGHLYCWPSNHVVWEPAKIVRWPSSGRFGISSTRTPFLWGPTAEDALSADHCPAETKDISALWKTASSELTSHIEFMVACYRKSLNENPVKS